MKINILSILRYFLSLKGTGNTIIKAVKVLQNHSVQLDNIIVLNLFCTPQG